MPKSKEQVSLKCPSCKGERFQVHQRGKFIVVPGEFDSVDRSLADFELDQVACQCLGCHLVSFLSDLVE